jgi:hypothetical protein
MQAEFLRFAFLLAFLIAELVHVKGEQQGGNNPANRREQGARQDFAP